jgi:hypothetical protein
MRDFIERLRAKPEHQRKQIAVGASAGVTGFVALGWIAAVTASGTLSLAPSEPILAEADRSTAEEVRSGFSELLGAASAFSNGTTTEAELTIVDTGSSSTIEPQPVADNRTVIPF